MPRYSWQLVWQGLRVEAEASEPAPDEWRRSRRWRAATRDDPTGARIPRARGRRVSRGAAHELGGGDRGLPAAEDPYLVAYALLRSAAAGCAEGDREAVAPALREAAQLAAAMGAAPLLEDVRALARRARVQIGGADGEPTRPGIDAFRLTQREREVLDLLAEGRSNGQIASELFITRKTASVHVSNILGKLGVANRGEATAMVHRLRAADPAA